MNLRRTYAFNSGMAFHSGGLVLYRQTTYAELGEEAGLHMVRSDHEDMRSTIYSALHPMDGYTATRLGFELGVHNPIWGSLKVLVIPAWAVLLIPGLPLGRWLVKAARKFRRARSGCCLACGYEMCASGNRCPECGASVLSGA